MLMFGMLAARPMAPPSIGASESLLLYRGFLPHERTVAVRGFDVCTEILLWTYRGIQPSYLIHTRMYALSSSLPVCRC